MGTRDITEGAGRFFGQLADRLNPPTDDEFSEEDRQWWEAVEEARLEWKNAHSYFQNVSDPELVDHAVHLLAAAEKKYSYLLHRMRCETGERKRDAT